MVMQSRARDAMLLLMLLTALALLTTTTTKLKHDVDRLEPIASQEVEARAAFCDGQAPGTFGAVWHDGDYFRDAWCNLATWWRDRS